MKGRGRPIARFRGGRRRSKRGRGGEDEAEKGVASQQDATANVDEGMSPAVYAEGNVPKSDNATIQKGEVINMKVTSSSYYSA